jgi:putative glycosyltransferase (TIGR04348 family)
MNILIVTPAPPGSKHGNRVTARRWSKVFRDLGHRVQIATSYSDQGCDALIALHARRSAGSIARFQRKFPDAPLIVALTGTDLYRDLDTHNSTARSLELATRIVIFQPHALNYLPQAERAKARVIYHAAPTLRSKPHKLKTVFEVCVSGHLRPVKDPFRAARAARLLPASSRIRIVHMGAALTSAMQRQALNEMTRHSRYRWLGELSGSAARRRLARSRLLVVSSKIEGGANVISEALAADVPILASRISGVLGRLGEDYEGYFEVGDTGALATLLRRAENDARYYRRLKQQCRRVAKYCSPARETRSWQQLLAELS